MSNLLQSRIPQLQREMEIIATNGWDPMFCVAKLSAVAADDAEGYCEALEEELAVKGERLAELVRTESLTAEIVERLRARISIDEQTIEQLRAENEKLIAEFKALKVKADDQRDMDRLVANLEAENLREARLAAKASAAAQKASLDAAKASNDAAYWKEQYEHAAAAAGEAQDAAHRASVLLQAEKDETMRWRCYYEDTVAMAASDATLRRATWAPLHAEGDA
jgi:hypothetical protein